MGFFSRNRTEFCFAAWMIYALPVMASGPSEERSSADPRRSGIDGLSLEMKFTQRQLRFEPNLGQLPPEIQYVVRGAGYSLALGSSPEVLSLAGTESATVRLKLPGSSSAAAWRPEETLPSVSHYYTSVDPSKWCENVPNYGRVRMENVFPGIDLVFYGNQQQLEYDFLLQPGADPSQIRLAFSGADSIKVDSAGDLVLTVQGKELRQKKPAVYQEVDGKRRQVRCEYQLLSGSGEVHLALAKYDTSRPLVVDPVLVYSTYLGGSDAGQAIAVDSLGAVYLTGYTNGGFPILNGEQSSYGGNSDAFVAKLNANGSLVYSGRPLLGLRHRHCR